jgi:hypothetical protein
MLVHIAVRSRWRIADIESDVCERCEAFDSLNETVDGGIVTGVFPPVRNVADRTVLVVDVLGTTLAEVMLARQTV